jgi:hypothetical protein
MGYKKHASGSESNFPWFVLRKQHDEGAVLLKNQHSPLQSYFARPATPAVCTAMR